VENISILRIKSKTLYVKHIIYFTTPTFKSDRVDNSNF